MRSKTQTGRCPPYVRVTYDMVESGFGRRHGLSEAQLDGTLGPEDGLGEEVRRNQGLLIGSLESGARAEDLVKAIQ